LLAIGLGALFYFLRELPTIARDLIQNELASRGLPPARFRIDDVSWRGIAIDDFELGDPVTLSFPHLYVGVSPTSLAMGRASSLKIDGLKMRGSLGPDGLSFGALDALRSESSKPAPDPTHAESPGAVLSRLPVEEIEINDAQLSLSTPEGPFDGELWLRVDNGRHVAFRFQSGAKEGLEAALGVSIEPFFLDAEAYLGPERRSLHLEPISIVLHRGKSGDGPRWAISLPAIDLLQDGDLYGPVQLKANGGGVEVVRPQLEIGNLDVDVVFDPQQRTTSGKVAIASIRQAGPGALTAPLALSATLVPTANQLVADFDLAGAGRQLVVRGRVEQDLDAGAGKARFQMQALEFTPETPLLGTLFPFLKENRIVATEGRAGLQGRADWSGQGLQTSLDLKLENVSIANNTAGAACLTGTIRLKGPPFETAEVEELSMALLNIGLQLGSGEARYRLQRQQMLTIERGEWSFLGGRIITAGHFDMDATEHPFLLAADAISLKELFKMLALEGLAGEGVLGGHLPILINEQRIEIQDGILASKRGGGWIRYRPPEGAPGKLAGLGISELIDFEAALRNFRFERLVLQINGDLRGSLTVKITLDGANPDYRDGQPYQLNLNLEGPLYRMYKAEKAAFSTPARRIEERVLENIGDLEVEAISLPPCVAPSAKEPIDTSLPSG
jgi:hypothetical protein